MTTLLLDKMRRIKNRMVRLKTRVETIRELLEKFLEDEGDMKSMNLTARQASQLVQPCLCCSSGLCAVMLPLHTQQHIQQAYLAVFWESDCKLCMGNSTVNMHHMSSARLLYQEPRALSHLYGTTGIFANNTLNIQIACHL